MARIPFKPTELEFSVYEGGLKSHKPPFTFHSGDWERQALPILFESARGYVAGNAGAGSTYAKNIAAFDKYSIVPRRLRPSLRDKDGNPLYSDPSTTVLGHKLDFPLALAPVGVLKIFNHQGEPAVARAAASVGIPYMLSTATSTSIEDVAEVHGPDATRWFQLYWPANQHNEITASLLSRAKNNGYTALFVTLDTYILGWRPSDMDHGYNPFIHADRIGVEIGLSDPVFQKQFRERHGYDIDESERHRG
jgi:lactate 2-monooxygenase